MKKSILQLIKFGIVGIIALLIDVGLLLFFKEVINLDALVASALSFSASVTVNYLLSMRFVFDSAQENKAKEFVVFVVLSIGGLVLNQLIMWFGMRFMAVYYLWVKGFALCIVPIYNFVTRKIFLEKKVG